MSLWDDPFTIGPTTVSGQMWTYGSKPKVRKMRGALFHKGPSPKPWIVTNHQAGNKSFKTWTEAMAYANARVTMFNASQRQARCPNEGRPCFCTGVCQAGLDARYQTKYGRETA